MSLAVDAVLRPIRTDDAFEETVERPLHAVKLEVFTAGQRRVYGTPEELAAIEADLASV